MVRPTLDGLCELEVGVRLTTQRMCFNTERYMDVRRQRIFNYALLAEQIDRNNSSVLGVAYVGYYRSLIVGIGAHLNMIDVGSTAGNANYRTNIQASTLLHELGHIMHLLHGGDESQNGKPNYVSMNYLYLYGFPDFEQAADDRYHRAVCHSGILLRDLSNSVAGAQLSFKWVCRMGVLMTWTKTASTKLWVCCAKARAFLMTLIAIRRWLRSM